LSFCLLGTMSKNFSSSDGIDRLWGGAHPICFWSWLYIPMINEGA
jgi:hypothetical protein